MDGEIVGYIAAAGSLSGVLIAVVSGVMTRKRTGAETTEKITQAAGGLVDRLAAANQRLETWSTEQDERIRRLEERLEVEREEREIDKKRWERERIAWRHILQVHAAYDALVIQKLEDEGIHLDLPPTPPLTPPTRASDYPEGRIADSRELS